MATATFDGIEIPLIYAVEVGREFIGERERTAGGKIRQDVVAVKRTWHLQSRPITQAKAKLLLDHLESIKYGPGDFHLDDFGSVQNTVCGIITPESIVESHAELSIEGVWHSNARELSLVVIEV
jgi:hypothetical protein